MCPFGIIVCVSLFYVIDTGSIGSRASHHVGVLYGMELGSVTLKRIGFFCFPIKHSTHTGWG